MPLMRHCFNLNPKVFPLSWEDYLETVEQALIHEEITYPKTITDQESAVYEKLPNSTKTLFRICRDLANHKDKQMPPGFFYAPADKLGIRLNCPGMKIYRALAAFEGVGLIKMHTKGVIWTEGQPLRRRFISGSLTQINLLRCILMY